MPTTITSIDDLQPLVGQSLGQSDWQPLDFARIQAFAGATGDHQWIHVDRERIAKESPFGAPIAHGYLTLSMVAGLFFEVLVLEGFAMIINYGCNKVRFPTPLKEGDRFRLALSLQSLTPIPESKWWEMTLTAQIEVEGARKPACVAEVVYRLLTP